MTADRLRQSIAYAPSIKLNDQRDGMPATTHRVRLDLTERELEVLQRMVAGRSNSQIAVDLHYSLATIRRETSSIYRKLNVSNRAEAAAAAVKLGVVDEHLGL